MAGNADQSDYSDGVEGAGSAWKSGVQDDQAQSRYETNSDSEAASEWQTEAAGAGDDYAEGIADYLGTSADNVTTAGDFTGGIDDESASKWQSRTGESGEKWATRVQETSADEYEENAMEAAGKWADEYEEGVTGD